MRLKAVFILCALALVTLTSCSKKDDNNKIESLLPANVRYEIQYNDKANASIYLNHGNTTYWPDYGNGPATVYEGESVKPGSKINITVKFTGGGTVTIYIGNDFILKQSKISGNGTFKYSRTL